MKKGILALGMAVMIFCGSVIPIQASDIAVLTFTKEDTLVYENVSEDGEYVDFGSAFEGVAAGESRTQTIRIQNKNEKTADFYMHTEVVKELESDTKTAKGAGYEIRITAGDKVLYDSMLGGYDTDASASTSGIKDMNEALEDDILIATLKSGESVDVDFSITFDGESMDNTTDIDYSLTKGQLTFDFKAGYEDPTGRTTVYKMVTKTSQPNYIKKIVEIFTDSSLLTSVKTGDASVTGIAVAVLLAGILFVIFGKRKKDGVLFLLILGMCLPTVKVFAMTQTYTVTFRSGNVGYFALNKNPNGNRQEMAQEVAKLLYSDYEYEVTKHGAIKVTVSANAAVPDAPTYIQTQEGYFVKDVSVWGPKSGQIVDKNMDFVADYGKLIDGVEYTVKYVDSVSGESIAPIYVAQANIGERKNLTAPKEIVISEGTVYLLESEETLEKVLEADAKENIFEFRYTMQSRETVEEEIISYADGGTVTITETVTIPINTQTGVVQEQEQNANAQISEEENTIEGDDTTEGENDTVEGQDENEEDGTVEGQNENEDTVEDENKEDTISEENEEDTIIDENTTKEENTTNEGTDVLPTAIGATAGVFGTTGITGLVLWLRSKRKNKTGK